MKWFGRTKKKVEAERYERYVNSVLNRNTALTTTITMHEHTTHKLMDEIAQEAKQAEQPQCCECVDALTKLSEENAVLKMQLAKAKAWYDKVQNQVPV